MLKVNGYLNIGDLRKTMDRWIDPDAFYINFELKRIFLEIYFKHSNNSFSVVFRNNISIGEEETFIKLKARIGNNVKLYGFEGRRILKGEMFY
jgi:hypothetical protein